MAGVKRPWQRALVAVGAAEVAISTEHKEVEWRGGRVLGNRGTRNDLPAYQPTGLYRTNSSPAYCGLPSGQPNSLPAFQANRLTSLPAYLLHRPNELSFSSSVGNVPLRLLSLILLQKRSGRCTPGFTS